MQACGSFVKKLRLDLKIRLVALLLIGLVAGCSSGQFDNAHDRYMSTFGLSFFPPSSKRGGLLGRALLQNGSPASWAQIDARKLSGDDRNPPIGTLANGQGGFYLGNLEPGSYAVYVISASGQGTYFTTEIQEDQVIEDDSITLQGLARISGHVTLKDETSHAGAMVIVPGSPFSAFTDHEGYYYLDVPRGTLQIRAEKDTFQAFESAPMTIEADTTLDITLEADPWPTGEVRVQAEDGFVVRGLQTTLTIEVGSGVRHMQILPLQGFMTSADGGRLGGWQPIAHTLELHHDADGYSAIQITFADAYNKLSEPIQVEWYNTSLEDSWQFFHGQINQPVVLRSGSKALFIEKSGFFSDRTGDRSIVARPTPIPSSTLSGSAPGDGDVARSASREPIFSDSVTIEAGVSLLGGAIFNGSLAINGTKTQPVRWRPSSDGIVQNLVFNGQSATIRYADISRMALQDAGSGIYEVLDSQITDFELFQEVSSKTKGGQSTQNPGDSQKPAGRWQFIHSSLHNGYIRQYCWYTASDFGQQPSKQSSEVGAELAITASTLEAVSIGLFCRQPPGERQMALTLHQNNFLSAPSGGYYFYSDRAPEGAPDEAGGAPNSGEDDVNDSSPRETTTASAIPSTDELRYNVQGNHFREPGRLHYLVHETQWPTALFGENVPAPHANVGPR